MSNISIVRFQSAPIQIKAKQKLGTPKHQRKALERLRSWVKISSTSEYLKRKGVFLPDMDSLTQPEFSDLILIKMAGLEYMPGFEASFKLKTARISPIYNPKTQGKTEIILVSVPCIVKSSIFSNIQFTCAVAHLKNLDKLVSGGHVKFHSVNVSALWKYNNKIDINLEDYTEPISDLDIRPYEEATQIAEIKLR